MKIILSGYGKMGRLIEQRAVEKNIAVAAVIDPAVEKKASAFNTGIFKSLSDFEKENVSANLARDYIAIDFTHPLAVMRNIQNFSEKRIPLVVGTTGWYDKLDDVVKMIAHNKSSLLWASNFSIGVNLFYRMTAYCAALIDPYSEYDAAGYEAHHNQKADSPSGTAKTIAEIVLKNMKRKTTVSFDKLDRQPEKNELHFASLRLGSIPGTHALVFDSPADSIEIKHTVRNREGLVSGAITAAEWLCKTASAGKSGVFTFDDVLA
jgi:4-hydroxy-tetrahydrodipicolinate reductase